MRDILHDLALYVGAPIAFMLALVYGLAWLLRVPSGDDDDDFKSGGRRFKT